MATQKSINDARMILPYLIRAAQTDKPVTYGELAHMLNRPPIGMGWVMAYIRDEICTRRELPLLSAIVVKVDTMLPGKDFLPGGTAHLSKDEYKAAFRRHKDEVIRYTGWDVLLKELSLTPLPRETQDEALEAEGREYAAALERTGHRGEADPHCHLKEFIAHHPEVIGLPVDAHSKIEYLFISGDRCDVIFDIGPQGHVVVEIKNGAIGELMKGIYQAIKYRALLSAEKGHGTNYPVQAFLVAYEMPQYIKDYAAPFDIRCIQIDRTKVMEI